MRLKGLVLSFAAWGLMVACTGLPFSRNVEADPAAAMSRDAGSARAEMELQNIGYDGRTLSGRLLVSPSEGRLTLDKRFIESIALSLKDVADCATGQALDFMVVDVLAPQPRDSDILVLEPGHWYGKDVVIPLFDEHLLGRQPSPECIEVELAFHALGGGIAARQRFRAVRAAQPTPDGGTIDAGAAP